MYCGFCATKTVTKWLFLGSKTLSSVNNRNLQHMKKKTTELVTSSYSTQLSTQKIVQERI